MTKESTPKETTIIHGDCLEKLKELPDNSVDSIVTDPPYGLSFMGKKWDYDVPSEDIWRECFRVLKHGGHLLSFAGTRTQHRMAVRIEDAGFEIRDMIAWVYGSGFPKSLDVSKAIDKSAGAQREEIGESKWANRTPNGCVGVRGNTFDKTKAITAPATEAAKQWQGWGTALKPALEPITVARKPLIGTVAENVQKHGTGALNIDGCRVGTDEDTSREHSGGYGLLHNGKPRGTAGVAGGSPLGRWPANLIHDGSEEVIGGFPVTGPSKVQARNQQERSDQPSKGFEYARTGVMGHNDSGGSAARFFYCAKASKKDRGKNNHPTVKPTDLMRYLCRLVTPPNGIVLDPFMGSGSTGKAARLEGFNFIGIEREAEYVEIAKARIDAAIKVDLFT